MTSAEIRELEELRDRIKGEVMRGGHVSSQMAIAAELDAIILKFKKEVELRSLPEFASSSGDTNAGCTCGPDWPLRGHGSDHAPGCPLSVRTMGTGGAMREALVAWIKNSGRYDANETPEQVADDFLIHAPKAEPKEAQAEGGALREAAEATLAILEVGHDPGIHHMADLDGRAGWIDRMIPVRERLRAALAPKERGKE